MRRERRIGREGVGATAKHVPGELEQNHKRKRSFWTLFQCREFTSRAASWIARNVELIAPAVSIIEEAPEYA